MIEENPKLRVRETIKLRSSVKFSAFKKLRMKLCLTQESCAELCGVTIRTVRNWDTKGAPDMAMRFLYMYDRQDLSSHGLEWKGFRFSRGKLVCGRMSFTSYNLKQLPYYVEVYNRLEMARIRYQDGLPIDRALGLVFGSSSFQQVPCLEDLRE